MDLERKTFRLDIEEVKADPAEDEPDFEGVLSVAGITDLQGDIIAEGAFTRTLTHHKGRVPLLIDHDHRNRLGVAHLQEVGKKLKLKGFVNKAKQMAVDALSDIKFTIKQKVPLGLSIGFDTMKFDPIETGRLLKEVALWEGSVVTFPALTQARVTKSITPFGDLPLADRGRKWDRAAAEKRVRVWSGAKDAPNEKYRSAFIFSDPEKQGDFSGCKLQIADVIDGKLIAIPRAIFTTAGMLQGTRGGINIQQADKNKAIEHFGRYFVKMGMEAPVKASYNFELDLWGVTDYAESIKGSSEELTDTTREVIESTAKALNALLGPTDAEIDAHLHSLYGEESEALGLSKEDDVIKALLEDHSRFLGEMNTQLQT